MYIWVLLATFIAILYSFNLPTRSDMREIYVEPQAEAIVSKMLLQHRAAENYARDLAIRLIIRATSTLSCCARKITFPTVWKAVIPPIPAKFRAGRRFSRGYIVWTRVRRDIRSP